MKIPEDYALNEEQFFKDKLHHLCAELEVKRKELRVKSQALWELEDKIRTVIHARDRVLGAKNVQQ